MLAPSGVDHAVDVRADEGAARDADVADGPEGRGAHNAAVSWVFLGVSVWVGGAGGCSEAVAAFRVGRWDARADGGEVWYGLDMGGGARVGKS